MAPEIVRQLMSFRELEQSQAKAIKVAYPSKLVSMWKMLCGSLWLGKLVHVAL